MDEYATTEYGTWSNYTSSDRPADTVGAFLAEFADEHDVDAIISDFCEAVNAALPPGWCLAGRNFYGPYPVPCRAGDVITAAIEDTDLESIARRHERTGE